jgi:hypothetical protein
MEMNLPKIQSKFYSEFNKFSRRTKHTISLLNNFFSIIKPFIVKLLTGSLLISAAIGTYWIVFPFSYKIGEEINSSFKIIELPNDLGKWILGITVLCLPFIIYYLGDFYISIINSLKKKNMRKEELLARYKELKEKECSHEYISSHHAMNSIRDQLRDIERELEKIG